MVKDLFPIVLALETLGYLIVNKCMGFKRKMKLHVCRTDQGLRYPFRGALENNSKHCLTKIGLFKIG